MKKLLFSSLLIASSAASAHDMVPAERQSAPLLITNATVHTVADGIKPSTSVLVEQGRIKAIGTNLVADGATVIDASGKHLYPGIVALDTQVGMVEITMVRPTVDTHDIGDNNADLRAAAVFNPDSEIIPTLRRNGITHAQIVPKGDLLAGQSAVINLDSWTVEDATVEAPTSLHLYWPELELTTSTEDREKANAEYEEVLAKITTLFAEASAFIQRKKAEPTLSHRRFEAMEGLFNGSAKLFIHTDDASGIREALTLINRYQLRAVIVGGYDAPVLAEELKAAKVAVIYPSVLSLPRHSDDNIDEAFAIPAKLAAAGVEFAIAYKGDWEARNLPYAAGYAAAHGLGREAALKAITLDAAKIAGVDDMGAIKAGYRANLVLADGDILDPFSGRVKQVFIDGRAIDLKTRSSQLYQKYLKR